MEFLKGLIIITESLADAKQAIQNKADVVLLKNLNQGGTFHLLIRKEFNKDNPLEMQKLHAEIIMKRLTHKGKRDLLGKGFCARVCCYEVDSVFLERLNPDSFYEHVQDNTLRRGTSADNQVVPV